MDLMYKADLIEQVRIMVGFIAFMVFIISPVVSTGEQNSKKMFICIGISILLAIVCLAIPGRPLMTQDQILDSLHRDCEVALYDPSINQVVVVDEEFSRFRVISIKSDHILRVDKMRADRACISQRDKLGWKWREQLFRDREESISSGYLIHIDCSRWREGEKL